MKGTKAKMDVQKEQKEAIAAGKLVLRAIKEEVNSYSPAVNCLTKIKFKIIPAKIKLNFLNFNGTVLKQHIFIEQIFIAH